LRGGFADSDGTQHRNAGGAANRGAGYELYRLLHPSSDRQEGPQIATSPADTHHARPEEAITPMDLCWLGNGGSLSCRYGGGISQGRGHTALPRRLPGFLGNTAADETIFSWKAGTEK
jgi:hypothetical protein